MALLHRCELAGLGLALNDVEDCGRGFVLVEHRLPLQVPHDHLHGWKLQELLEQGLTGSVWQQEACELDALLLDSELVGMQQEEDSEGAK